MKPLAPPDTMHLTAAEGWLELGNHLEANEELERIAPLMRGHPDVLEIRWHIYAKADKWDMCVEIASALIRLAPERSDSWVHRSFALHCLKRTQEAFDNLLPVTETFSGVWEVSYNLACYAAQLGRIEAAEQWFKKAMAIDEKATQRAGIDDPDLKPLWDSIANTVWKKLP